MRISCWLMAFCAVIVSPSAFAATAVDDISGIVMISQGSGYTRIEQPMPVRPGDTIMARRSGSARLVYDDGCEVLIEANTIVVVQEAPPCKASAPVSKETGFAIGAAGILSSTVMITRKSPAPVSP